MYSEPCYCHSVCTSESCYCQWVYNSGCTTEPCYCHSVCTSEPCYCHSVCTTESCYSGCTTELCYCHSRCKKEPCYCHSGCTTEPCYCHCQWVYNMGVQQSPTLLLPQCRCTTVVVQQSPATAAIGVQHTAATVQQTPATVTALLLPQWVYNRALHCTTEPSTDNRALLLFYRALHCQSGTTALLQICVHQSPATAIVVYNNTAKVVQPSPVCTTEPCFCHYNKALLLP